MHKQHPFFNHNMQQIVDEVLQHSVSDILGQGMAVKSPSANIKETNTDYIIELVSPGLTKGDFDISIADGKLHIKVDKSAEASSTDTKTIKAEWDYNHWDRNFVIGENINVNNIVAKYDLGILAIHLTKKIADQSKSSIKVDIE
jgi:HSP20 family protein